jgi:hypothetical protein
MKTERMTTAEAQIQKWLNEALEGKGAKIVETFGYREDDEERLVTSFEYEGRDYNIALGTGLHWMSDTWQEMEDEPLYEDFQRII